MTILLPRPSPDDAAAYYFTYIDQVPEGDVLAVLETGVAETRRLLHGLAPDDAEAWERVGTASGVAFRVRALPFILAGHEIHHRRLLAERYLADPLG